MKNDNIGFLAGKPVTGSRLAGREKIIQDILKLTLSGQSIVLIAPRRYGKTSVLLEVLNRVRAKKQFISYVDFFTTPTKNILAEKITESVLANKKMNEAFYKFKTNISELLKQIEFKQTVEDFEFILNFTDSSKNVDQLLSNSLDFIDAFANKYNKKIISGFDEFGDLTKLDGTEIVKLFRSKLQLQHNASYIFSGSYESVMNDLFVSSKSPFYRFARIIKLESIAKPSFKTYLKNIFSNLSLSLSDKVIDKILSFTGGHPYYTQLICQQIELCKNKFSQVSENEVCEFIESAMWVENNYIVKLWEDLTKSKENIPVLLSLAKEENFIYADIERKKVNVSRVIKRLVNTGIVVKSEKRYLLTDPLLKYWIKRNIFGKSKTECV